MFSIKRHTVFTCTGHHCRSHVSLIWLSKLNDPVTDLIKLKSLSELLLSGYQDEIIW